MSTSDKAMKRWRETFDELCACRVNRVEVWGDVDDITLASYIDNKCSKEERRAVEEAMEKKPAVRELVDFLRDMIGPVWVQQSAGEIAAFTAPLQSDVPMGPHRSVLSERLRVWLDQAGQLMADGVELLLGPARPLAAPVRTRGSVKSALQEFGAETPSDCESVTEEYCWQIPVEELGYQLSMGLRRLASPERWDVRCGISSDVDPRIAERARFQIAQPNAKPVVQSTLAELHKQDVEVPSGAWEVTITVGDDIRVLPLELGSPSS